MCTQPGESKTGILNHRDLCFVQLGLRHAFMYQYIMHACNYLLIVYYIGRRNMAALSQISEILDM